jgi:hypothetical protein
MSNYVRQSTFRQSAENCKAFPYGGLGAACRVTLRERRLPRLSPAWTDRASPTVQAGLVGRSQHLVRDQALLIRRPSRALSRLARNQVAGCGLGANGQRSRRVCHLRCRIENDRCNRYLRSVGPRGRQPVRQRSNSSKTLLGRGRRQIVKTCLCALPVIKNLNVFRKFLAEPERWLGLLRQNAAL